MNGYLITFRSVTPAQRGENILRKNGLDCVLRRTPRWMEEQGCGYSLRVNDGIGAVSILRAHSVPFRKVYLQRSGKAEEVEL